MWFPLWIHTRLSCFCVFCLAAPQAPSLNWLPYLPRQWAPAFYPTRGEMEGGQNHRWRSRARTANEFILSNCLEAAEEAEIIFWWPAAICLLPSQNCLQPWPVYLAASKAAGKQWGSTQLQEPFLGSSTIFPVPFSFCIIYTLHCNQLF